MKKVLLMCVSMLLVAALSIGGTLAYLTSTDSAVNVMTIGNVKIEQIEQQRTADGESLENFKQNKQLLPSGTPQEYDIWENDSYKFLVDTGKKALPNVIDKIITVKNTGNTDAYVRTIIAFEAPDGFEHVTDNKVPGWKLMRNAKYEGIAGTYSNTDWKWDWQDEKIEIDGVKYTVAVVTHEDILAAGDTTIPSLLQYYITEACDNEDLAALGEYVNILAVSQAVQASGFADAYKAFELSGLPTNPWAAATATAEVDSASELAQALAAGNDVKLTADVAIDDSVVVPEGATVAIDLAGKKLSITAEGRTYAIENYGNLTVTNGTIEVTNEDGGSAIANYGTLTVNDATLDGAPWGGVTSNWPSYVVNNYGVATINNTTVVGDHGGVASNAGAKTVMNNVNVTVGTPDMSSHCVYAVGDVEINGGSLQFNAGSHSSCNTVYVAKTANADIAADVELAKQPYYAK